MGGAVIEVPASPIRFDQTPASVAGAPVLGQHTEEVLLDLGLTFDEILAHKSRATLF